MATTEFSGFDDWVDVFAGGRQRDSAGKLHDGDKIIDRAVATFDPAGHEPPVVLGHPKTDAPAYGWVKAVRAVARSGKRVLQARLGQVVPAFADMVAAGRYKKRSASFYPDGRLRHVGFLGAMPPAVKGLADLAFADDDGSIGFEFADGRELSLVARAFRRIREWIIEDKGADAADRVIGSWEIDELERAAREDSAETPMEAASYAERREEESMSWKDKMKAAFGRAVDEMPEAAAPAAPAAQPAPEAKAFSEADVEARVKAAAEKAAKDARDAATAEFAEKERTARDKARKQEIIAFVDQGVTAGKIIPAWKKAGLVEFMEQLDGEAVVEFAEGADNKKTPYAWFKGFVEDLPKIIDFGEVAKRGAAADGPATSGGKLDALVARKMKENPKLDYGAAFSETQSEHPDLAAEYAQEME